MVIKKKHFQLFLNSYYFVFSLYTKYIYIKDTLIQFWGYITHT